MTPTSTASPPRRRTRGAPWSSEEIITAIRDWTALHGTPPAAKDWRYTIGSSPARRERARHNVQDLGWPNGTVVLRWFGTWNNAIRAAGFEPRPQKGSKQELGS